MKHKLYIASGLAPPPPMKNSRYILANQHWLQVPPPGPPCPWAHKAALLYCEHRLILHHKKKEQEEDDEEEEEEGGE